MQEKKANLKERHQMHSQIEELEMQNRALKEKIKEVSEAINRDSSVQEDHKPGQEVVAEGPQIKTYNLLQLLDLDHELN
jgi:chaperonin cofactor prefoldin